MRRKKRGFLYFLGAALFFTPHFLIAASSDALEGRVEEHEVAPETTTTPFPVNNLWEEVFEEKEETDRGAPNCCQQASCRHRSFLSGCWGRCCCGVQNTWMLQAKVAYFWPFTQHFSQIYGGAGIYGIELSRSLQPFFSGCSAWLDANYLYVSGKTLGNPSYTTNLTMVPFSLGLEYMPHCRWRSFVLRPFIGLGLDVAYFSLHNHIPLAPTRISSGGVGGIGRLGCILDLPCSWFFNLFSTYSYMKAQGCNLSGGSLGAGIGYSW